MFLDVKAVVKDIQRYQDVELGIETKSTTFSILGSLTKAVVSSVTARHGDEGLLN